MGEGDQSATFLQQFFYQILLVGKKKPPSLSSIAFENKSSWFIMAFCPTTSLDKRNDYIACKCKGETKQ